MAIRKLEKDDDFEELVTLSRDFFDEYEAYHKDFFDIDILEEKDIVDYFSLFIDKKDRAAFIALLDNKITGYITISTQTQPAYWRIKNVGVISGLMVSKTSRRNKVGTQLLGQAKSWFTDQGVDYYTVYTAFANNDAIAFYKKQGMEHLYSHFLGQL